MEDLWSTNVASKMYMLIDTYVVMLLMFKIIFLTIVNIIVLLMIVLRN